MGDPTILLTVYGLALAPLGVGALSLPARRLWARRPLARAQKSLSTATRAWGWSAPRRYELRQIAAGSLLGYQTELSVGPDLRSRTSGANLHTVWIQVRIDLSGIAPVPPRLLLEPHRGVLVRGPTEWAAVWLGLGLEELARPSDQLEVEAGCLRFDRFATTRSELDVRPVAERLAAIVSRLREDPAELSARLSQLALHHELPSVRRRSLRALLRTPADPDALRAVARKALRDTDAPTRLAAATHLGREGERSLWNIVESDPDEDHRLHALEALAHCRSSLARSAAEHLMAHGSARVVRNAVEHASLEALHALVFDLTRPGEHRAIALEALEARERDGSVARARDLLGDPEPRVRVAAIDILGRNGSIDDLSEVRRAGARAPTGSELFISSRTALELIRERTRGEGGRMSIVETDDERAGRVSVHER